MKLSRARSQSSKSTQRVFAATWYGDLVGAEATGRKELAEGRRLAAVLAILKRVGKRDLIVATEGAIKPSGLIFLAVGLIAIRNRSLILLEFLPGRRSGPWGRCVTFAYRLLLHRCLKVAQVMTEWERVRYADLYRIPIGRIVHQPFYEYDDRKELAPRVEAGGVMSSGRNSCDWTTLAAAARGQDWQLTIVCSAKDERVVRQHFSGTAARIRVDAPRQEHDELLNHSSVYVLPLLETEKSAGHVRLMSAATSGVPVVASDTRGIDGYSHLAARLFHPGDSEELRGHVNELLADKAVRESRARAITEAARRRPFSKYAEEITTLIHAQSLAD